MIRKLAEDVLKGGGRLYIVGGFVRDRLLNRENKDIDIEIFGINRERLEEILSKYGNFRYVGRSFPIYILKDFEISIAMEDDRILNVNEIDVAINRRDLTINSLMYDPLEDKIIDHLNGREDLDEKKLKYITREGFIKDPLRILRVASFKARLEFEVCEDLEKLCIENSEKLEEISKERKFIELEKILMKSNNPAIAFNWLERIGVLENNFGVDLKKFEKLDETFNCFEKKERTVDLMFSIFYLKEKNYYNYLKWITNNRDIKLGVKALLENLIDFYKFEESKIIIKKLFIKVDLEKIIKLYIANEKSFGREPDYNYIDKIRKYYNSVKESLEPILNGADIIELGIKEGKDIGVILEKVFTAQLEEKISDKKSALDYCKGLIEKGRE